MEFKLAKPVEGRLVRNPVGGAIVPAEGMLVKVDSFWSRRLLDGDITLEAVTKTKEEKEHKKQ